MLPLEAREIPPPGAGQVPAVRAATTTEQVMKKCPTGLERVMAESYSRVVLSKPKDKQAEFVAGLCEQLGLGEYQHVLQVLDQWSSA